MGLLGRAAGLLEVLDVGAGRKRPLARTGEQHDANGAVFVELVEDGRHPLPHRVRDGVALLRPVEDDGRHRAVAADEQMVAGRRGARCFSARVAHAPTGAGQSRRSLPPFAT